MMVTWDNESQLSIDPSLIGASIETYLHSKLTVGAWDTGLIPVRRKMKLS